MSDPQLKPLTAVRPAGHWDATRQASTITLTYDERYRRRRVLTADNGTACVLSLPRAVPLSEGDGLEGPEGEIYAIVAAPEPLLSITAESPMALMRLAWHLGNRHTPAALHRDHILIRPDHVLADMLRGLGATVVEARAPFQPERGAYHDHGAGTGPGHSHD
ncbi:MAG: urease accessory protein UreE [Bradymonadia bacterium]